MSPVPGGSGFVAKGELGRAMAGWWSGWLSSLGRCSLCARPHIERVSDDQDCLDHCNSPKTRVMVGSRKAVVGRGIELHLLPEAWRKFMPRPICKGGASACRVPSCGSSSSKVLLTRRPRLPSITVAFIAKSVALSTARRLRCIGGHRTLR